MDTKLNFKNGLPYLRCRKPTEAELSSLPHIIINSDVNWDPKQYDITFDEIEQFHDTSQVDFEHEHFDQYGEYRHRTVATHSLVSEEEFFDALEYSKVADIVDTSLIHYVLTMFAVLMLLILATLPQLHPTLNCSALSLVGRLLTPLSVRLK
jgi:hypothetical protein